MTAGHADSERFAPRSDAIYIYLMEGAAEGSVPVYTVEAPISAFQAHDPFWGPQHAPDGIAVMKGVMKKISEGEALRPWVYPLGGKLIYADDYFLMACLRMLRVQHVRAFHLLMPPPDMPAHGPLALDTVRDLIASSVVSVRT